MGNSIDDPSDITGRAKRQLERAREMEHPEDSAAVASWGYDMLTSDFSPATVTNRVNPIVKLAERADKPLVEFESKDDVTDLLVSLADGSHPDVKEGGLSDGTIRAYRQAARLFFRDELDREWGEDIVLGQMDQSSVTEDQILTNADVDALLDSATNTRDAALVAFLTVTGQRISAMLSIRVGDVDFTQDTGTIFLNKDAVGLKGADGPRPMLWARPYIASWLNNHPKQKDDDAPLFCATQSGRRPKEDGGFVEWEAGDALSPSQIRNRLRALADAADIDKDKIKPHNFRHTAITRMRDKGVADDRIRFMVGVADDSNILEHYDQAENERMLARLREDYGIEDPAAKGTDVGKPTLDTCPQCQAPLREGARFCSACGTPMDVTAAEQASRTRSAIVDDMAEFSDPLKRKLAREGFEEVENDPDFIEQVAARVAERMGSD